MARPEKEGLDYCNIDVDIFDDPKLLFVCERFGEKGELIAIKLLLYIYKNGYYCEWNNEIAVLFANRRLKNISCDLLNDVVGELLKRRFFNEGLFKSFGILTSRGIQQRWTEVVGRAKRKCKIRPEYDLFLPQKMEETPSKQELTPPKQEETPSEQEETTQSKVKKSKEKKSKDAVEFFSGPQNQKSAEGDKSPPSSAPPPQQWPPGWSEDLRLKWEGWKTVRFEKHKEQFSYHQETAALAQLAALSGGQEAKAAQILLDAASGGWKHLYKTKNSEQGHSNQTTNADRKARLGQKLAGFTNPGGHDHNGSDKGGW